LLKFIFTRTGPKVLDEKRENISDELARSKPVHYSPIGYAAISFRAISRSARYLKQIAGDGFVSYQL
jgi:hypothetical protein